MRSLVRGKWNFVSDVFITNWHIWWQSSCFYDMSHTIHSTTVSKRLVHIWDSWRVCPIEIQGKEHLLWIEGWKPTTSTQCIPYSRIPRWHYYNIVTTIIRIWNSGAVVLVKWIWHAGRSSTIFENNKPLDVWMLVESGAPRCHWSMLWRLRLLAFLTWLQNPKCLPWHHEVPALARQPF